MVVNKKECSLNNRRAMDRKVLSISYFQLQFLDRSVPLEAVNASNNKKIV
jgi:hypothetical protein